MKAVLYVPDIECDSCIKVINRRLKDKEGIKSYLVKEEALIIDYDEEKIKNNELLQMIKDLGFRASFNPFERKTFKERWKDLKENQHKYQLELKGIQYSIAVFFILLILELIAYTLFLKNIPEFITRYVMWLFYLNVSIASLGMALWHFTAYRAKVTCMVGMMIGMTFGMQTGLMIGAIIGATNGFFIGALTGMLLGVIIGILTGKCCGIMGVMEGIMAGVMGGTMGPMISVMMLYDNIVWFMPVYILINIIILIGLSYMLYEEIIEHKQVEKQPAGFINFAIFSIVIASILIIIMLYAPKSYVIAALGA